MQESFAPKLEDDRARLDRLEQIATRVPGVIYQYRLRPDGTSCFPYASESIRNIYQVAPDDVREDASPVFERLHPEDFPTVVASIQRSAATMEPWRCEYRVKFADGTVQWLDGNAMPQREADGSILWHGFVTDITARRALEQALRDEIEKSHALLRGASDGVTIMDKDGNIVEVSDSFCAMLGYTREEMIGRNVVTWDCGTHGPDAVIDLVRGQLITGKRSQFETRHRRRDGTTYDVEITGWPLELGGSPFLFNSSRDITARKQVEAELAKYRQHLKALVEERTASLRLAKEAAETANRAKNTFLANMSHELRTPLNGIMGMTYLAQLRATDPGQREQLAKVKLASEHLLGIIKDILDISRIEAERLQLEEGSFEVGEVLRRVDALLRGQATHKGLTFAVESDPALSALAFRGDAKRLAQVLVNLIGNAIKFTDRGTVTLRVRFVERGATGVALRFDVQDTGAGVAPDDHARIFAAFEQGDSSATRRHGGAGLGLAISKRLVDAMGGTLSLQSEVGVGSTFTFTVHLPEAPPTSAQASSQSASELLRERHAGAYVLVVEDNALNREVAQALLEAVGLQVHLAEDGAEGVRKVKRTNYDVILMDLQMPVLDGIGATRQIRALPNGLDVPIIALTANVFEEDQHLCDKVGMNDFIGRPVRAEQLYDTLLEWLDARAG